MGEFAQKHMDVFFRRHVTWQKFSKTLAVATIFVPGDSRDSCAVCVLMPRECSGAPVNHLRGPRCQVIKDPISIRHVGYFSGLSCCSR